MCVSLFIALLAVAVHADEGGASFRRQAAARKSTRAFATLSLESASSDAAGTPCPGEATCDKHNVCEIAAPLCVAKVGRTDAPRVHFCKYVVARFAAEVAGAKDGTVGAKLRAGLAAAGDDCAKMAAYRCDKWAPDSPWKAAA